MNTKILYSFFILIMVLTSCIVLNAQDGVNFKNYKGNAILGNGNLCLVYCDDPQMFPINKKKGIIHFYYSTYAVDYIASSSFDLFDELGKKIETSDSVYLSNFFTAATKRTVSLGKILTDKCFVTADDAAVLFSENSITGVNKKFTLTFRKNIVTDRVTTLKSLRKVGNNAVATFSDNTAFVVTPMATDFSFSMQNDSVVVFDFSTPKQTKIGVIVSVAKTESEAIEIARKTAGNQEIEEKTLIHWNVWMTNGIVPEFQASKINSSLYIDYYKRTLYSVKSATVNGQIPADMTGQFMTNGMPQLYPRDAMMVARVLLMTGHLVEAKQIIKFWADLAIPKKSTGEYYARYDANTKAVDAGSGARFDEPEWDANGYYIQLINEYFKKTGEMLCSLEFLYTLADFLVSKIDSNGLLYEGGIVEWTAYLPSTNMTCSAGLQTISQMAKTAGDSERAKKYAAASEKISSSFKFMFDKERKTLSAVRYHGTKTGDNFSLTDKSGDKKYLWDASLYFGILWGYQDSPEMKSTDAFQQKHTVALGGGMRYFEAMDNGGLSDYGGDCFFFTTAAAAQYLCKNGDYTGAKKHIDWMIENSNSYGLMPERVHLNGKDISEASPLSWCNAEFAASILALSNYKGFVTTSGKSIIDSDGNKLFLKGINLGNWLVPEGYMFLFQSASSPKRIYDLVNELIGPAQANRFWDSFRDNYITKDDIDYIKKSGFNSVRVPFNFRLFSNEEAPGIDLDLGFRYLDRVIDWCRSESLYVVLDMHCAPGGQTGDNIDDSYGYPFLFESQESRALTIRIWERIAARYANERIVIGYDLLNEPIAHYFDVAKLNPYLEPFYKELTAAIREVDKNHLIILGGAQWDSNFKIFNAPYDSKLVYSFHKYWTPTTQDVIQEYIDFSNKFNTPLWMGESGENTHQWITEFRILLEKNDIGWCFWPYKRMDSDRCVKSVNKPENYDIVIKYAESSRKNFGAIRDSIPDRAKVLNILNHYLENIKFKNCVENAGYLKALGIKVND